jgi:hypothetical protein
MKARLASRGLHGTRNCWRRKSGSQFRCSFAYSPAQRVATVAVARKLSRRNVVPLFKKRPPAAPIDPTWVGRKLHSDLEPDACIANFRAALAASGIASGDDRLFHADWTGIARSIPAEVIGISLPESGTTTGAGSAIYLAIWPNGGYDEGSYQEMALVPPSWDSNDPLPYIGAWKQIDNSLASTGRVAGASFGVVPRR